MLISRTTALIGLALALLAIFALVLDQTGTQYGHSTFCQDFKIGTSKLYLETHTKLRYDESSKQFVIDSPCNGIDSYTIFFKREKVLARVYQVVASIRGDDSSTVMKVLKLYGFQSVPAMLSQPTSVWSRDSSAQLVGVQIYNRPVMELTITHR